MREDRAILADQVSSWISAFIAERAGPAATDPDRDLFAEGGLDSLGIVNLIVGLEGRFGLRLTEEDLQDPRFTTIRGLAEIVSEASRRTSV